MKKYILIVFFALLCSPRPMVAQSDTAQYGLSVGVKIGIHTISPNILIDDLWTCPDLVDTVQCDFVYG